MFAVACATDGKTAGWLPESYGFLRIHKVNNYYAMAEYQVVWPNAELWRGYYNAGDDGLKWSGWQPIATATPPQEFDLPLADGYTPQYTHSCIYYKTQETIVGVNVALIGEIPANSDVIIGTLPVGFRPKATCRGVAGSHFSPYGVGSVSIDGNGNINVRFTAAQVRCNFTICFLAAD